MLRRPLAFFLMQARLSEASPHMHAREAGCVATETPVLVHTAQQQYLASDRVQVLGETKDVGLVVVGREARERERRSVKLSLFVTRIRPYKGKQRLMYAF